MSHPESKSRDEKEWEAGIFRLLEKIRLAREAIEKAAGGRWRKGQPSCGGNMDCPVCGGGKTLTWHRAGVNGHIRWDCTTEGCVHWVD